MAPSIVTNVKNVNDLISTINSISTRLLEESGDVAQDLQLARSWIEFTKLQSCDLAQFAYLLNEGIPKLVRSVLKRKFSTNTNHQETAKGLLEDASEVFAEHLNKGYEGTWSCLTELLDPTQHFYTKYGFAKPSSSSSTSITPTNKQKEIQEFPILSEEHMSWLRQLEAEVVIDYERSPGKWEYYTIEAIHSHQSELVLLPLDGGNTIRVNMNTEGHKLAPFATKSGQIINDTTTTTTTTTSSSIQHDHTALFSSADIQVHPNAQTIGGNQLPADGDVIEKIQWKYHMKVGDLIDACDKNNIWYQACILDVRIVQPLDTSHPITGVSTQNPNIANTNITATGQTTSSTTTPATTTTTTTNTTTTSIKNKTMREEVDESENSMKIMKLDSDHPIMSYNTTTNISATTTTTNTLPRSHGIINSSNQKDIIIIDDDDDDDDDGEINKNDIFSTNPSRLTPQYSYNMMIEVDSDEETQMDVISGMNTSTIPTPDLHSHMFLEEILNADDMKTDFSLITNVVNNTTFPNTSTTNIAPSTATTSSSSSSVSKEIWYRVSYIGQPEKFDEWINAKNTRIEPLNTKSEGKRGENPIREEIYYVIDHNTCIQNDDSIKTEVCINMKASQFYSTYITDVITKFHTHGGFESIITHLTRTQDSIIQTANSANDTKNAVSYSDMDITTTAAEQDALIESNTATTTTTTTATTSDNNTISLVTAIDAIISLGNIHSLLSHRILSDLATSYIQTATYILKHIDMNSLRNITVEKLESALHSIDHIAYRYYRYIPLSSGLHEGIWISSILLLLESPYLNKKLGGLKLLTDILNRALASREYPTGLRITRVQNDMEDNISLQVYPIFYTLSFTTITSSLFDSNIFQRLYQGELAHHSLLNKSKNILKILAKENCLTQDLLQLLWQVGCYEHKKEAISLLIELISDMNLSLLLQMLDYMRLQEPECTLLTAEILDLWYTIGVRARYTLMRADAKYNKNATIISIEDDDIAAHIHSKVIDYLWIYIQDTCPISSQLSSLCVTKLESLISTGISTSDACSNCHFPWMTQWLRTYDVMKKCYICIKNHTSYVPAIKLLQACICVWPTYEDSIQSTVSNNSIQANTETLPTLLLNSDINVNGSDSNLDILLGRDVYHSRLDVANFLQREYILISIIIDNIIYVRTLLKSQLSTMSPPVKEMNIDAIKVGSSRVSYAEILEIFLNFLHVFLRCSPNLYLDYSLIEQLWYAFIPDSVSLDETNYIINFIDRILLKNIKPNIAPVTNTTTTTNTTTIDLTEGVVAGSSNYATNEPLQLSTEGSSTLSTTTTDATKSTLDNILLNKSKQYESKQSIVKRKAMVTSETVTKIFTNLLYQASFIQASYFSSKALSCIQKYFCWINAEYGHIIEKKDFFTIVKPTSQLIGLDIFFEIIVTVQADSVATDAVLFLTSLPSRLSSALLASGELVLLRTNIVYKCIQALSSHAQSYTTTIPTPNNSDMITTTNTNTNSVNGTSTHFSLSRILVLINGVLDESSKDTYLHAVTSHQSVWYNTSVSSSTSGDSMNDSQNNTQLITIKLVFSHKEWKELKQSITLHTQDTITHLLQKIASIVNTETMYLKLFVLGKDISTESPHKTLKELKITDGITVMIAKKQNVSIPTTTTTTTAASSTTATTTSNSNTMDLEILNQMRKANCNLPVMIYSTPSPMKYMYF